jgi:hypothetical protein
MTDDEERELKQELLMADVHLRRKQDIWEHPRNIAILVGATAALFSAVAGWAGFQAGRNESRPSVVIQFPPSLAPQLGSPTVVAPPK